MYTPRKPAPPTTFETFKQDNWAIAGAVIPGILIVSSLILLATTPADQRFEGFWQAINLMLYPPLLFAVTFLYWRVPRRVKRIQKIWEDGDFIIGTVLKVQQNPRPNTPNILYYSYTYNGETYEKTHMVGTFWKPRPSIELGLIVVPGKPDQVILTDLY